MDKKFYSLVQNGDTAELNIYGDITSYKWDESDVTAHDLSKQLTELAGVSSIDVRINSYGGEVATGLAIYNALKNHKAKVRTICDGFACSIASVIFMAGEERVMNEASLLMIHNAWSWAMGNANELRKQADDLEKITQASVNAYMAHSTLSEDEVKALLDAETWLLPSEALEYGFATSIMEEESKQPSQSVKKQLLDIIKQHRVQAAEEPQDEPEEEPDEEPEDEPETPVDEPEEPDNGDDGDNPEEDPEESPEENTEAEVAQKWSGFFAALTKM
ncbi:MAG: Clp protease ClpP [Akkermansia sp.]|nr:Clp protease ClpP [Akkermansia sp.]